MCVSTNAPIFLDSLSFSIQATSNETQGMCKSYHFGPTTTQKKVDDQKKLWGKKDIDNVEGRAHFRVGQGKGPTSSSLLRRKQFHHFLWIAASYSLLYSSQPF